MSQQYPAVDDATSIYVSDHEKTAGVQRSCVPRWQLDGHPRRLRQRQQCAAVSAGSLCAIPRRSRGTGRAARMPPGCAGPVMAKPCSMEATGLMAGCIRRWSCLVAERTRIPNASFPIREVSRSRRRLRCFSTRMAGHLAARNRPPRPRPLQWGDLRRRSRCVRYWPLHDRSASCAEPGQRTPPRSSWTTPAGRTGNGHGRWTFGVRALGAFVAPKLAL